MKFLATTIAFTAATVGLASASAQQDQQYVSEPTRALRAAVITPGNVQDATLATFTIAQAIVPLLSEMFKKKECHQLACWVATPTEACGMTAANQVQRELTKGRNSFAVESVGETGMWVRYWRTQFSPPDRGDVAEGTCGGGSTFVVTNCQQTGKVYC